MVRDALPFSAIEDGIMTISNVFFLFFDGKFECAIVILADFPSVIRLHATFGVTHILWNAMRLLLHLLR